MYEHSINRIMQAFGQQVPMQKLTGRQLLELRQTLWHALEAAYLQGFNDAEVAARDEVKSNA